MNSERQRMSRLSDGDLYAEAKQKGTSKSVLNAFSAVSPPASLRDRGYIEAKKALVAATYRAELEITAGRLGIPERLDVSRVKDTDLSSEIYEWTWGDDARAGMGMPTRRDGGRATYCEEHGLLQGVS